MVRDFLPLASYRETMEDTLILAVGLGDWPVSLVVTAAPNAQAMFHNG